MPADIERIGQPFGIVGADIEHHRQHFVGVDAGAGGIERQFSDRDTHAARTLIAQTQDTLAIGHHDHLHPVERRIGQDIADPPAIGPRQEQPARPAENLAEPFAAFAHRRGIDQRQHARQIALHQRVEQHFVGILQFAQEGIAVKIAVHAVDHAHPAHDLFLQRKDMGRQQPVQSKPVTLRLGKGGAAIGHRIVEQGTRAIIVHDHG